ncbi:MAG: DNA topoisomerase IB, partial [Alphaproteobacteria bacterium]
TDSDPGITRHKAGKGFSYKDADGQTVRDKATLQRIRSLAIPPAYTAVWVCANPNGHIQATGRDDRGRKQYRYHAEWNAARDLTKYGRMLHFAYLLPKIRRRVRTHMAQPGLGRNKVLATVVNLLETTLIRVGNEDYARTNKSYGLSTLRDRHVQIKGSELRFRFTGKSGKEWNLKLADRRLAKVVKACQDIPGQKLFQYLTEDGERHAVTSQDINSYLRDITGEDITAKDFRTWAGTVLAAGELRQADLATSPTAAKRTITTAVKAVAAKLGNTPAICRKCYVHPDIFVCYQKGRLHQDIAPIVASQRKALAGLRTEEAAVVVLLTPKSGSRKPATILAKTV